MLHFSLKTNTPIFKLITLIQYKNGYFGPFQNFFFNAGEEKQTNDDLRKSSRTQNKESDFVYIWRADQTQRFQETLPATGKVTTGAPVCIDVYAQKLFLPSNLHGTVI